MTDDQKDLERQATPGRSHDGPSWGLMLAFIAVAMVVALVIAWVFIHPLLHRHI